MTKIISAADTRPLRLAVLRPGGTEDEVNFPHDDDPETVHFGALENGEIVSVGSLYFEPRDVGPPQGWRLRGMATAPGKRGRGFGAEILQACIAHAQIHQGGEIWCNARVKAANFYRRHGFTALNSEPFDMPGIGPHFLMSLIMRRLR